MKTKTTHELAVGQLWCSKASGNLWRIVRLAGELVVVRRERQGCTWGTSTWHRESWSPEVDNLVLVKPEPIGG